MLPRKAPKIASAATAAPLEGRDGISNLPDCVLQHILSFLPAQDAVRTCVLAKRWRHLWKSTTVLRFLYGRRKENIEFVDQRLRLQIREDTPLDTCEFRFCPDDENPDDENEVFDFDNSHIMLWIRIGLQCKLRVLKWICVGYDFHNIYPQDGHPFFISQHLKKLELEGLEGFPNRMLDFSCCPNLEDLKINECYLDVLISSQSLKHLTIQRGHFSYELRLSIFAPNLVSLWLEVCYGRSPSLERMPSLLTACIKINGCDVVTLNSDNDSNESILLQGLSEVQNLVLISRDIDMFIFRRDLQFCSSFNKLKSLLIDEYWCWPADFSALACLLKLSPVLEKLTLQLYSEGPNHKVEIKLSCKPLEISTEISQHLKTLEVKCEEYDDGVHNVLTFLSKQLNIWFQFSG